MVRLRSRLSVRHTEDKRLIVQTSPGRRLMFAGVAAVLTTAFFVGVDWSIDFRSEMLAGSMFYFALTIVCILVAGWSSAIVFDSSAKSVEFLKHLFGLTVNRRSVDATRVAGVSLQGVRLLKDSERPRAGMLGSRFTNYVSRRNTYYKLYLEVDERREFLEDSTDPGELQVAGESIAAFLGVAFRVEDI